MQGFTILHINENKEKVNNQQISLILTKKKVIFKYFNNINKKLMLRNLFLSNDHNMKHKLKN